MKLISEVSPLNEISTSDTPEITKISSSSPEIEISPVTVTVMAPLEQNASEVYDLSSSRSNDGVNLTSGVFNELTALTSNNYPNVENLTTHNQVMNFNVIGGHRA